MKKLCSGILLIASFTFLIDGGYILLKAELAQYLLRQSWNETQANQVNVKPWSWFDSWPVARILIPSLAIDEVVLAQASAQSLAFAPAWEAMSAEPGTDGVSVISGHRDTHFKFLQHLKQGDRVLIEKIDGRKISFQVNHHQIVDSRITQITADSNEPLLLLTTCYPFDSLVAGGPLRYVVELKKI